MKSTVQSLFAACALLFASSSSWALTQDEVIAFVNEAAEYYQAHGQEAAFAEFQNSGGKFHRGELYVFISDLTGTVLAHGTIPKLVGKNLVAMKLKDAKGAPFAQMLVDKAVAGGGWVEYSWTHPVDKSVKPKMSYVKTIDNKMFIAAGMYK